MEDASAYIRDHYRPLNKLTRICLVTSAISGPTLNGGVATAFFSLANHLAKSRGANGRAEFKVTVLYAAHPYYSSGTAQVWQHHFRSLDIEFVPLPEPNIEFYGPKFAIRAFRIFEWLRDREADFDVISYHDYMANGYYVALAKWQGLHFHKVALVVQCHSTVRWADMLNSRPPKDHNTLGYYYMEQKSIEYADVRISPSLYYLHWMHNEGRYNLSHGVSFVVQNTLYPAPIKAQQLAIHKSRHFVFFARLEVRKGLMVFLDALDALSSTETSTPSTVTFLGPDVMIDGRQASDIIRARAKESRWSFSLHLDHSLNTEKALEYIAEHEAITVLPTLGDNSPYVVMEIVARSLPLITTDAGGGKELFIDDPDQTVVVPKQDAKALAKLMEIAMTKGISNVQMSSSFLETRNLYLELMRCFHAQLDPLDSTSPKALFVPTAKVTVGITTFNRASSLLECVQSVANQDYPRELLHVLIVDDASSDTDVGPALEMSSLLLHERGISHDIIRQPSHQFVAITRNQIFERSLQRNDDFVCLLVRPVPHFLSAHDAG